MVRGASITTLTLITLVAAVVGLTNRRGYGVALAVGAATPTGAAVVVGAVAVPTFFAVATGAAAGVVLRELRRDPATELAALEPVPGLRRLVALCVLAALVTLLAPFAFDGMTVMSSPGQEQRLVAGTVTESNLAQLVYLVLNVFVVAHLARAKWAGPQIVGFSVGATVLLSFWAWSAQYGVPFPTGVFDNSPGFTRLDAFPGGAPRVRGILSEASGLGATALVAMGYSGAKVAGTRGWPRLAHLALLAVAVFLGFASTSTTFYIASAILVVLAVAVPLVGIVARGHLLSPRSAVVSGLVLLVAFWAVPRVVAALNAVLATKVTSFSYDERSGADDSSLRIVVDTVGIGVGVGSNRGSSFVFSQLSTIGVVGVVLLLSAVWTLTRISWSDRRLRPVLWAMFALLITKSISGPDLNDTAGTLFLCLGVLAHAALSRSRQTPSTPRGRGSGPSRAPAHRTRPGTPPGTGTEPVSTGPAHTPSGSAPRAGRHRNSGEAQNA